MDRSFSESRTSSLSTSRSGFGSHLIPWDEQLLNFRGTVQEYEEERAIFPVRVHTTQQPPEQERYQASVSSSNSSRSHTENQSRLSSSSSKKQQQQVTPSPTGVQYSLPRSNGRMGRKGASSSCQQHTRSKSQPPENKLKRV